MQSVQTPPWGELRNILAVRMDNVGDVVMLSPALRALRTALPEARITLLATRAGTKVAPLLPWIDGVLTYRPVWQEISDTAVFEPEADHRFIEELKAPGFEAALIFTSFSQSAHPPAFICKRAGIPHRLGQSKETGDSLTYSIPSLPEEAHQVDRSLHLLESAGIPVDRRDLELQIPEEVQDRATAILEDSGVDAAGSFMVLAPGASCPSRRYDAARFAAVLRLLRKRTGVPVIVAGSDAEVDLCHSLLADAGEPLHRSIAGRSSIAEMAEIIRRADLLIANNSGPMHLAEAVRTPLVVLFSGTDSPAQWMPRSTPSRLLFRTVTCAPCRAFQCPYAMECLDVPPEEVVSASIALLDGE